MRKPQIGELNAFEVLDSRGRPTIEVECRLRCGARGVASVPAGASTGTREATELRDGEPRYAGWGCRRAVASVKGPIAELVRGRALGGQKELDQLLIDGDGTWDKRRLGANAILGVSLAFSRACADSAGRDLFEHLAGLAETEPRLPRLTVNLFSGGVHAGGQVPVQDVLVVPTAANGVAESLEIVSAVYESAAKLCKSRYQDRALVADEGGLAPRFGSPEEMLYLAVESIEQAGFSAGPEVALGVDVAATHFFYRDGGYRVGEQLLSSEELAERVAGWVEAFPLLSVEDPLAEDDWSHWTEFTRTVGGRTTVVGDDLLTTNPVRIERAVRERAANGLLLKPNQIGTISEALVAAQLARSAGWRVIASARSGDTEDHWLADLACGWAADDVKIGSVRRSERLAKYNRLLQIEARGARAR